MNPSHPPSPPRPSHRKFWIATGIALVLLSLPIFALANFLKVGNDAEALCSSLMTASGEDWATTLKLQAGSITVSLAKLGLSWVELPPEARSALQSVRAVEVGIYQRRNRPASKNHATILAAAETTMTERGWERLAGVVDRHVTVAVYLPAGPISERDTKVCAVVMEKNQMVVVWARADLEPLLALAADHMPSRR